MNCVIIMIMYIVLISVLASSLCDVETLWAYDTQPGFFSSERFRTIGIMGQIFLGQLKFFKTNHEKALFDHYISLKYINFRFL